MKYKDLLINSSAGIVQEILNQMHPNLRKVSDIKPAIVPKEPILYRWWFPETFVKEVLVPYTKEYPGLKTLLGEVSTQQIDEKTYYALYFGKSNNGYRRYCQHTTGNVHLSTIRHTVYGLCIGEKYDKAKEDKVSEILRQCYYEWISFKGEDNLVECVEGICIALGKYPLNVDGNPAISDQWRDHVMNSRKLK